MVAKNKKDKPISENDRLKAQLLNAVLDRAQADMTSAKVRKENALLSMVIAQRDINTADADLTVYAAELQKRYGFDMKADSVDWTTGVIHRGSNGEGGSDGQG